MAWLIGPALLLFVVFFVLPFGVMATMSLLSGNPVANPNAVWTLRHYERFAGDDLYTDALWSTLRIGLITTVAALLIGYPLAHWMARMQSRIGHALLLMAVIAPMLTGIVVRTFAWMTLLANRGAMIDELREVHLGVPRPDPDAPRASELLAAAYEAAL